MPKDDKRSPAEKFADWFGKDTRNFIGTGLTAEQFMMVNRADTIRRSWTMVEYKERQTRLQYVLDLAVELHRIKKVHVYATGTAAHIIEDLITGDYKSMQIMTNSLKNDNDMGDLQETWKGFLELAEQAHAALTSEGIEA